MYSLIIHRWSIKQHLHLGKFRYKIATFSPSTAPAPSLKEARERLKQDSMTKDELAAYYRHLDNIVILRDNINTEREEGRAEGLEKGRAEGLEEGARKKAIKVARYLKSSGTAMELIIGATGLSKEEIEKL